MRNKQNKFIFSDCIRSYSGAHQQLENLKGKTLLITGGTGFMGSWVCEMVHYMNEAHNMGIIIHTLGIGTSTGGPIPIHDENGNRKTFKKNRNGSVVTSTLNESILDE